VCTVFAASTNFDMLYFHWVQSIVIFSLRLYYSHMT
jgi:hypothetical protein